MKMYFGLGMVVVSTIGMHLVPSAIPVLTVGASLFGGLYLMAQAVGEGM